MKTRNGVNKLFDRKLFEFIRTAFCQTICLPHFFFSSHFLSLISCHSFIKPGFSHRSPSVTPIKSPVGRPEVERRARLEEQEQESKAQAEREKAERARQAAAELPGALKDPAFKSYAAKKQFQSTGRPKTGKTRGTWAGSKTNARALGDPVLRRDPTAQVCKR